MYVMNACIFWILIEYTFNYSSPTEREFLLCFCWNLTVTFSWQSEPERYIMHIYIKIYLINSWIFKILIEYTFNYGAPTKRALLLSFCWNPTVTCSCQSEPERTKIMLLMKTQFWKLEVNSLDTYNSMGTPTKRAFFIVLLLGSDSNFFMSEWAKKN